MPSQARRPLLGSLASTPWLSTQGEVLAVQCVRFLLEDGRCEAALRRLLAARTARDMSSVLEWRAESVQDEGRPDLIGTLVGEQTPRVVLEAKFDHLITGEQIQAYARHLSAHPDPVLTALVLLVPDHRRAEAERALTSWTAEAASGTAVISWDELVESLREAADGDASLVGDVGQFEALCETYGGRDIRPFTADEVTGWPARAKDLKVIVDRVTAGLSTERLLPIGSEADATQDGRGYYRRYVSGERGSEGKWMSIGIRQSRKPHDTPVWLRYHARTEGLQAVKDRLQAAAVPVSVAKRGHVYVPLSLPVGVSGVEVVRQLQDQVRQVHSAALGRSWPGGRREDRAGA